MTESQGYPRLHEPLGDRVLRVKVGKGAAVTVPGAYASAKAGFVASPSFKDNGLFADACVGIGAMLNFAPRNIAGLLAGTRIGWEVAIEAVRPSNQVFGLASQSLKLGLFGNSVDPAKLGEDYSVSLSSRSTTLSMRQCILGGELYITPRTIDQLLHELKLGFEMALEEGYLDFERSLRNDSLSAADVG